MNRRHFHVASAANSYGNRTRLDVLGGKNQEQLRLFVVCFAGPRSWISSPDEPIVNSHHQIAAQYVRDFGRWSIVNLDGAPIPNGAKFDVVYEDTDSRVFVHVTTQNDVSRNFTVLPIEGKSTRTAQLFVSPRLRPLDRLSEVRIDGLDISALASSPHFSLLDTLGDNKISSAVRPFGGVHWNHPIGVWFNEELESWTIVNMDLAPMDPGLLFNVANISAIHGSGVTQHYGTVVSTGRTGSVQSFCLSPCDASPAFSVTVNMSWRYQTDLLQGGMSRESLLGSVVQRVIPARRCRSPLAVGVDQQLYPVFPRRHGRFEERTFLIYSDRLSIPEGVGFNVCHLGSA